MVLVGLPLLSVPGVPCRALLWMAAVVRAGTRLGSRKRFDDVGVADGDLRSVGDLRDRRVVDSHDGEDANEPEIARRGPRNNGVDITDGCLGVYVEAVCVEVDAAVDRGRIVIGVLDDHQGGSDRSIRRRQAGAGLLGADLEFHVAAGQARRLRTAAQVHRGVGAGGEDEYVSVPGPIGRRGVLIDLRPLSNIGVARLIEGKQREGTSDRDFGIVIGGGGLAPGVGKVIAYPKAAVQVGGEILDYALGFELPAGPRSSQRAALLKSSVVRFTLGTDAPPMNWYQSPTVPPAVWPLSTSTMSLGLTVTDVASISLVVSVGVCVAAA